MRFTSTAVLALTFSALTVIACDRNDKNPAAGRTGPRGNAPAGNQSGGAEAARRQGPRAGGGNSLAAKPGGATANDKKGAGQRVTVTEILISFDGAGTKATRTKEEAEKLANEIFNKAKANSEPFAALRKQTDSTGMPIYGICIGKEKKNPTDRLRSEVPAAVADAAFLMKDDEVRLVPWDATKNPAGFYIIKRLN